MKVYYYRKNNVTEIRVGVLEKDLFVSITGYSFRVNPGDFTYLREYKG